MTKIRKRAASVLVLIALLLTGVGFYVFKYFTDGAAWASFASNQTVYTNGVLTAGKITDRTGLVLWQGKDGHAAYNDDSLIRKATLHAVGDRWGNIGTGAVYAFKKKLTGYNPITGAYSMTGSGGKVTLSINAELTADAYSLLNGRKGTIAICDCDTGEALCMATSPSYDPDNMPDSFDSSEYDGVYINRFLSASYTPGSIFKLVTMAAAIENIPDLFDKTYYCEGSYQVGGDVVKCTGTHGTLTAEDALAVSCNCAFAQISLELGSDVIAEYADKYGITDSIVIDGIETASGRFDKAESGSVDEAWSGIGQYNDLVNPAVMLRLMAAIANGGRAPELTLTARSHKAGTDRIMKESTAEKLGEMMNYNVYKSYGEGNYPGIEMHAKSGTAEMGLDVSPHALFVGYGVKNGKTLAFFIIVENGGYGSSVAGGIASQIMQRAFELCG